MGRLPVFWCSAVAPIVAPDVLMSHAYSTCTCTCVVCVGVCVRVCVCVCVCTAQHESGQAQRLSVCSCSVLRFVSLLHRVKNGADPTTNPYLTHTITSHSPVTYTSLMTLQLS